MITVSGKELSSKVCPICPGGLKISPPEAMAAHLDYHEKKGKSVCRKCGAVFNKGWRKICQNCVAKRTNYQRGHRAGSGKRIKEKPENIRALPGARK